jgi:hypothetical protein
MGRNVVLAYVCVLPRPRVRDGTPAEVVCGYFGDWFYRVGNGRRAAPVRAALLPSLPPDFSLSLSLSLYLPLFLTLPVLPSDCTRA